MLGEVFAFGYDMRNLPHFWLCVDEREDSVIGWYYNSFTHALDWYDGLRYLKMQFFNDVTLQHFKRFIVPKTVGLYGDMLLWYPHAYELGLNQIIQDNEPDSFEYIGNHSANREYQTFKLFEDPESDKYINPFHLCNAFWTDTPYWFAICKRPTPLDRIDPEMDCVCRENNFYPKYIRPCIEIKKEYFDKFWNPMVETASGESSFNNFITEFKLD